MAISSRGEMGVGGGSRGGSIGGGAVRRRANSAAAAKVVKPKDKAKPKATVKTVPAGSPTQNAIKNNIATANAQRAKSGLEASASARQTATGKPKTTVKINSGGNVKSASTLKGRLASYTPNPGRLPNLIKIDSAKGNTVKKTAYRPNRRTSN